MTSSYPKDEFVEATAMLTEVLYAELDNEMHGGYLKIDRADRELRKRGVDVSKRYASAILNAHPMTDEWGEDTWLIRDPEDVYDTRERAEIRE